MTRDLEKLIEIELEVHESERKEIDLNLRTLPIDVRLRDNLLSEALRVEQLGNARQAMILCLALIRLIKDDSVILSTFAGIAFRAGQFNLSVLLYDQMSIIERNNPGPYFGKGSALVCMNRPSEALENFDFCLQLGMTAPELHSNRATALMDLGRFDEADEQINEAIRLAPSLASAHLNRSLIWLAKGDYIRGFREYEWGWINGRRGLLRYQSIPRWTGVESLIDKKILIFSEQGLGDIIQFSRFLNRVSKLGAKVTFATEERIIPLLAASFKEILFVKDFNIDSADFDFQCPMISVVAALNVSLAEVGEVAPYIFPPERTEFKKDFSLDRRFFNIGICTQGRQGSQVDLGRSFPPSLLVARLSKIKNIKIFLLSKNGSGDLLSNSGIDTSVISDQFDRDGAFVDTAALLKNLALVISTDTSIAHLAGAVGAPTWLLLKHVPDWRWGLNGDRTPWYQSIRIFRQKPNGDWEKLIDEIMPFFAQLAQRNGAKVSAVQFDLERG
jgi:tetratricopeptide (TPR) repeat protein